MVYWIAESLCGTTLVELAGNRSSRMQGKAVNGDTSHGGILLQNHPGALWRKMLSAGCCGHSVLQKLELALCVMGSKQTGTGQQNPFPPAISL